MGAGKAEPLSLSLEWTLPEGLHEVSEGLQCLAYQVSDSTSLSTNSPHRLLEF